MGGILLGVSLRCTFPVPKARSRVSMRGCGAVSRSVTPPVPARRARTCPPPRGPFKARPSRAGQVRAGDVMQQEAGLGLPLPRSARRGKRRRRLRTWVRGGRGECGTGTGTGARPGAAGGGAREVPVWLRVRCSLGGFPLRRYSAVLAAVSALSLQPRFIIC